MMTLGTGLGLDKGRKPISGGSTYTNSFLGPSGQEIFQPDGASIFLQPS
jgi:hypothetical protein